jgi:hypothetical protein
MRYDRADFIQVYLAAHANVDGRFGDYEAECDDYNDVLRRYYRGLLAALERLFVVDLDVQRAEGFDAKVFLMMFRSTVDSCLAVRTPWSGYAETTLLVRRIEESGEPGLRVIEACRAIERLHAQSVAAHLTALDAIAEILLGSLADAVYDSDDVLAVGFDDAARPDRADFPSLLE